MGFLKIILILGIIARIDSQANFATTTPFYAQKYAEVPAPRGLIVDDSGDVLVLSRGSGRIIALTEVPNGDGTVRVEQNIIVNGVGLGLTHGLAFDNGYLYASCSEAVSRWPYVPGSRTLIKTPHEIVISNIPSGGGLYATRTLIFDKEGRLYVSVGAAVNVEEDSTRAKINRFDLSAGIPAGGIEFGRGEVVAHGLRNSVGFDFDKSGTLWGVELGATNLHRPDLGGDIHNGNPADELNRFSRPLGDRTHYGYPYCFSSYDLPGQLKGTQFAWPEFMNDGTHTDAWCRNVANNQPPALALPAHHTPLGIGFYDGRGCGDKVGALPCNATGDAFVAFHGSWNSDVNVGYRVAWLPFKKDAIEPTGQDINVIYEPNLNTCLNCLRPVNVVFDLDGHLIVSADSTNEIFRVYYNSQPPPISDVSGARNLGGALGLLLTALLFACSAFLK